MSTETKENAAPQENREATAELTSESAVSTSAVAEKPAQAEVTESAAQAAPDQAQPVDKAAAEASEPDQAPAAQTPAQAQPADEAAAEVPSEDQTPQADLKKGAPKRANRAKAQLPDVSRELNRLVDLSTKYPEIGPALADLAERIGYHQTTQRILSMGLEQGGDGIEFHFIAARLARKENDSQKVLKLVSKALGTLAQWPEDRTLKSTSELLHLVRMGFATLLFDIGDPHGAPRFTATVAGVLPSLSRHFDKNPFYEALVAQALWFTDRGASESVWDDAVKLDDPETTWNARGTWYKEAEKDLAKAEATYRQGLEAVPQSPLLLHNLGQVILESIPPEGDALAEARTRVNEVDRILRSALRAAHRPRFKRHIHATLDRLKRLRAAMPGQAEKEERKPPKKLAVGDVVEARVRNITTYGAFLDLEGRRSGLLHKTEMSHDRVHEPADHVNVGDVINVKIIELRPNENGKGVRIGLSIKALQPAPERPKGQAREGREERGKRGRNEGRGRRENRGNKPSRNASSGGSLGTLGDLLRAKFQEPDSGDS